MWCISSSGSLAPAVLFFQRKDKPFCLIWNAQKLKEGQVNISSLGEVAIIPKQFFYDLLKAYTIQNNI